MAAGAPARARLGTGYDPEAGRRLVVTNAVRTVGWTGRGVLVAVLAVAAIT